MCHPVPRFFASRSAFSIVKELLSLLAIGILLLIEESLSFSKSIIKSSESL
jgi:hypothetical protein